MEEKLAALAAVFQASYERLQRPSPPYPDGFEREFYVLHQEDEEVQSRIKCHVAWENAELNRYTDISPYDHNRVKLLNSTNDYINASYIKNVLPGVPEFIATQGPMPHTTQDFWRMINQTKSALLVMLTGIVEGSKVKCHQYWPELGSTVTFEYEAQIFLDVTTTEDTVGLAWSRRVMQLQERRGNVTIGTHEVVQYQYTDWPDRGVPAEPEMFISFVRVMISAQCAIQEKSSHDVPIATHCSAGIGRTGTFIAVYAVFDAIRRQLPMKEIQLFEIVQRMREQRRYMLQTKEQYRFIYDVIYKSFPRLRRGSFGAGTNPTLERAASIAASPRMRRKGGLVDRTIAMSAQRASVTSAISEGLEGYEYAELIRLVSAPDLIALKSLVAVLSRAEVEPLTDILFKVFGTQGALVPFAIRVAQWEVDNCESEKLLFRGNSFITKVIGACFNLYGSKYLLNLMLPLFKQMSETPKMSYEVNPDALAKGENLGENRATLRRVTDQFFSAIINSANHVPLAMHLICHGIAKAVSAKFPEASLNAVGGALFLRFYTPFIVSPESYGVLDKEKIELTAPTKRGLLLISKIIQTVTNLSSTASFREEYMQPMNTFVATAVPRAITFLTAVSTAPGLLDPDTLAKCQRYQIHLTCRASTSSDMSVAGPMKDGVVSNGVEPIDLIKLHQLFSDHISDVKRIMSNFQGAEVATRLVELIKKIGPPGNPTLLPPSVWTVDGFRGFEARSRQSEQSTASSRERRFSQLLNTSWLSDQQFSSNTQADTVVVYPGSNVRPCAIKSPLWDVLEPEYEPVEYTSAEILALPEGADPNLRREAAVCLFNSLDQALRVDRRSFEGKYKVINGIPRNPMHRTGFTGRGVLGRWGPNHTADALITRFLRDHAGEVVYRCGRPVIEFLAQLLPDGSFQLPCDYVDYDSIVPISVQEAFGDIKYGIEPSHSEQDTESLEGIFQHGLEIYKGYLRDERNTDNAWIETIVVNFHDNNRVFQQYELRGEHRLAWLMAEDVHDLNTRHKDLLSAVVESFGGFFVDRVPASLRTLLEAIETHGLETIGLYRLSGNFTNVKALCEQLFFEDLPDLSEVEIHELAGTVKFILRDMTPPLMTFVLYHELIQCVSHEDDFYHIQQVSKVLEKLPSSNFGMLYFLIHHLKKVVEHEEQNRMSLNNICLVFGPTIMRSATSVMEDLQNSGVYLKLMKAIMSIPDASWELMRYGAIGFDRCDQINESRFKRRASVQVSFRRGLSAPAPTSTAEGRRGSFGNKTAPRRPSAQPSAPLNLPPSSTAKSSSLSPAFRKLPSGAPESKSSPSSPSHTSSRLTLMPISKVQTHTPEDAIDSSFDFLNQHLESARGSEKSSTLRSGITLSPSPASSAASSPANSPGAAKKAAPPIPKKPMVTTKLVPIADVSSTDEDDLPPPPPVADFSLTSKTIAEEDADLPPPPMSPTDIQSPPTLFSPPTLSPPSEDSVQIPRIPKEIRHDESHLHMPFARSPNSIRRGSPSWDAKPASPSPLRKTESFNRDRKRNDSTNSSITSNPSLSPSKSSGPLEMKRELKFKHEEEAPKPIQIVRPVPLQFTLHSTQEANTTSDDDEEGEEEDNEEPDETNVDEDVEEEETVVSWYISDATREEIRGLKNQHHGIFLVHDSKTQPGNYCISVWTGTSIWTGLIVSEHDHFAIEGCEKQFPTLRKLITYYTEAKCPGCECRLYIDPKKEVAAQEAAEEAEEQEAVAQPTATPETVTNSTTVLASPAEASTTSPRRASVRFIPPRTKPGHLDDILMKQLKHSGWLMKSSSGKSLKRRWFVLQDTMLKYYHSVPKGAETASEYINISAETLIDKSGPREFTLSNVDKTFRLQAKTEPEAQEWFQKLSSAKEVAGGSSRA